MANSDNGWGFVVTSGSQTLYSYARTFGFGRAFICLLEAVTPLVALILLQRLPSHFAYPRLDGQPGQPPGLEEGLWIEIAAAMRAALPTAEIPKKRRRGRTHPPGKSSSSLVDCSS